MVWKIANEVSHRMGKINSRTASAKHDIQWVNYSVFKVRELPLVELTRKAIMKIKYEIKKQGSWFICLINQDGVSYKPRWFPTEKCARSFGELIKFRNSK